MYIWGILLYDDEFSKLTHSSFRIHGHVNYSKTYRNTAMLQHECLNNWIS